MKFLVDNQLPHALADYLRAKGHDGMHVIDVGMDEAFDKDVWLHATGENRVVVSKDEDFVFLANRPADSGKLIWVRLGNCRNAALLTAFEAVLNDLVSAIQSGQRIVELR